MEKTLGQKRIGNFNASGEGVIDQIKQKSADLLDYINDNVTAELSSLEDQPEMMRLKALALTAVEEASMKAVKAYIHYKK